MTVHTVKSLLAKSEEEGECKLWTGYHGGNHGETPYVFHDGRMEPVRRLMARLLGKEVLPGHFWGCTCGNHSCIEPRHAIQRSHREHTQNMARIAAESPSHKGRIAKLTVIRQAMASLDAERAAEIRSSTESGVLLAARYGVSRQTVNAIRRGERWKDRGNPFAGLGA